MLTARASMQLIDRTFNVNSKLTHYQILADLENEILSFEKILSKCKRLARLRDDFEALDWLTLELHGYAESDLPPGIKREDLYKFAVRSGRGTVEKNPTTQQFENKYWAASIAQLEAEIQGYTIALENLKPPSQYTPAIRSGSYNSIYTGQTSHQHVVEKYQDVLTAIARQRNDIINGITHKKLLITKIKNTIYNYALSMNMQLKFENITESVFQRTKERVDKKLSEICPTAMKKFVAAYERLKSPNPEEWSQALSSCRNILKDFADYVFPAASTPYMCRDGRSLAVTNDKYKNRLLAFIDTQYTGNRRKLLMTRLADLESRVHSLNDILSQGTHAEEGLDSVDVNICVIDTYLLIGSLLSLTNAPEME
jgi:hypothetical protein